MESQALSSPESRPEAPRVLFASFYFPPAGGGGVQRTLKLTKHLAALGIATHVLAPDDPRWIHRDPSLRPADGVAVHRARYLGPRGRLPAYELYGHGALDRALRRALQLPRRLLLPDENVPWLATALPAAVRLVNRERIDVLVTTSPPSSVQLLGALVKRLTGVRWIADLRDSIVAKEDRAVERRLARLKERSHAPVARLVAGLADGVVAVTETIAAEIRELDPSVRIAVIPNGCDPEDFDGLEYRRADRFRITHTGSFFGKRNPRPFLEALTRMAPDVTARFIGDFRPADRAWAARLGLGERLELRPFSSHAEAIAAQRDSDALLLLLPEIGPRGLDIPSGKIYEYLAARRPILAAVPPAGSAAAIVEEAGAGLVVSPDDGAAIAAALGELVDRWRNGGLPDSELPGELAVRLSREARAREYADFLAEIL